MLTIAYPLMVFAGLNWFSVRELAAGFAVVVAIRLGLGAARSGNLATMLVLGLAWGLPIIAATILNSELSLRLVPAMINGGMLIAFASTLRTTPMIERFARLQVPDLNAAQQNHCRQFTWLWCLFFIGNGAIALVTSFGSREVWALYNGLLSYLLIAVMFVVEFVVRRHRFREFSDAFHDRILRRLLPAGERWPNA